jgi:glycosyltransferase involved in cell wall biosynthesis
MRIAIVNEGLSYPPNAGNRIRTLNLMLPLARRHDITYVCRGTVDPAEMEAARAFYAANGIRAIITEDHAPEKKGLGFYARLAGNLLSPLPYSVATHNSPAVRRAVRELAAREKIDLWQFEVPAYADVLRGTGARTVIMAHNVESLIWQRLYETERHPVKRFYIRHQLAKYERFERRTLARADRVIAVTDADAALFRDRFGVERVDVVDNGVDLAFFDQVARTRAPEPANMLFLGSLDWRPNVDSLDALVNQILPGVRASVPGATLRIVGRNPSPSLVRELRDVPGVELCANVADVRPFLARATVMAVPLRIGGGSRLKILEAAAAGVPVVTTRVGSEGLAFADRRDMLIVEHVSEMAAALIDCLQRPAMAAAMASGALRVVRGRYDWQGLADRLEAIWTSVAAPASATR